MATLPMNKDVRARNERPQISCSTTEGLGVRDLPPAFARQFSSEPSTTSLSPALDRRTTAIDQPRAANREPYMSRIVFKSRGRVLFLPVSEIRWIGAEENYVRLCMERETHLLRETMMRIEQKLDPSMFLRVHRSAMVNLLFVKDVRTEEQGDFVVYLVNGQRVPMSRSYHSRLGDLLTRKPGRVA
jgi:two-component system LytT family response regulator